MRKMLLSAEPRRTLPKSQLSSCPEDKQVVHGQHPLLGSAEDKRMLMGKKPSSSSIHTVLRRPQACSPCLEHGFVYFGLSFPAAPGMRSCSLGAVVPQSKAASAPRDQKM